MLEYKINNTIVQLDKEDLTLMHFESIVFYANNDLVLGSGFGNAIAVRGGNTIQDELNTYGTLSTCDAVISSGGNLKSDFIIHAVGPRFQEKDFEKKLRVTILNVLSKADEKHIKEIGFPTMGAGFYGVPLDECASIMLDTFGEYLSGNTSIEKIVIVVIDQREYKAFEKLWYHKKELGIKL